MPGPIKFLLYLILIPVILLVAAAVLVPIFLDKDKVLELAATTLHEETGATLTVDGETELSIFPSIGVSMAGASITMPGKQQPDLQARFLEIGVQLMPLFSGRVEIDTISLDGLDLRIEPAPPEESTDTSQMNDVQLDEFYAKRRRAMEETGEAVGAEAALAVPLALNVQHLIITDSRVTMIDPVADQATVVEIVRMESTGLNLDGLPIPLALEIRLPGEQPLAINMQGKVRVNQETQIATVDAFNVELSGATPEPLQLKTSGTVDLSRQVADLQLALELGKTRGDGTLRYANFESPQIDTRLKLNLLDPALLVLAGPEAAAEADNETTGASGDEPLPLDALRLIDTRADLTVAKAVFGAHTIENMHTNLRAADGVVQVNTLTGTLHGGELDVKATFNAKHNTAKLNTTGGMQGLDIATAMVALKSEPVLSGNANLNWQLNSKGRTVNELTQAMTGPIKLTTEQVVLQKMSIEHLLCQAVALTNQERLTATFPTTSSFKTLGADIQLSDGKARLNPLRAELPQIGLNGTGTFDLLSQDFKASVKASLSPELEQLDRACRVSKRLTGIDWPVNCKGSVSEGSEVSCKVDTEEIIQDMAKQEAGRQIQKEAGKLMDKFFKK
jgi:AsmA protein